MDDLFGEDETPPEGEGQKKPEDLIKGHRQRLRSRFMSGGPSALADYELLELALFSAIPRRDTKPLAKRLIARFGGFAGAISAEPSRLREVDGVGEAVVIELKLIEAAAHALARGRSLTQPTLSDWESVLGHCRATMAHGAVEEFRVLFLDKKNRLIADESQGRGTVDEVAVYPREVVKRALELNASALILAHNHPSGDPTPSKADVEITARLVAAAETVGLLVHDHVIVGAKEAVSLRGRGLMGSRR